ncbi:MAG: preprotein translocase subunit Tim44 [Oleispira sp.]|nr:preprotein translocase subunit Tim44 [Oleispira sp.]|tara:strand:- start:3426 stop:4310 length:885 start_codon:yes stop_codon:yes gene_type:complete
MKSIITAFTAFFLMFAMVSEADAKRFGGGGFGKTFKTSPFASKKATPAKKDQQQAQPGQKKGGMMGGLMGGLLAGGLFAALLGSGAFEDLQIMDMVIMAALAFLAFKLFKGFMSGGARSRQQPSAAGFGGNQNQPRHNFEMPRDAGSQAAHNQEAPATQATGFNQNEVPFNLPEGFDQQSFIEGSLSHYRTVQESWNNGELETIEEYVSPELFAALSQQRNKLMIPPQTEILDLSAEIVRADQAGDSAEISILFRGVCKDDLEKSQDGIFDIWHLQRDLSTENADWVIVGIEAE